MNSVIDEKGYRECVGIILVNLQHRIFWGQRIGNQNAWQFPQGGILKHEIPEEAVYRELWEEIGLQSQQVKMIAKTKDWLKYNLPKAMIHQGRLPLCKGQKQIWFLLEMLVTDEQIVLERTNTPEFTAWRWVDYWYPLRRVVAFKRTVYRQVLKEFAPLVFKGLHHKSTH